MIKTALDKLSFFLGIIFFYNQLKKNKLVSSEPEFYLLKKFIKKNDSVVDIGANIGRYSFELSKIVGHKGIVYSFEPILRNYLTFISLIFIHGTKNIIPFNIALSDETKLLKMNEVKTSIRYKVLFNTYTASKVHKEGSLNHYSIKLDNLKKKKKISFIKIDVEGHEMQVLRGAKNIIKKNKPIILIQDNDKKVINYLKSWGYEQAKIKMKNGRKNYLFIYKKNINIFYKSIN
jgi:FkbM family methyltransferase